MKTTFQSTARWITLGLATLLSLPVWAEGPQSITKVTEIASEEVSVSPVRSATFEVDVPAEAFSLFVQVVGNKNLHYYFEKIENPQGRIILGKTRAGIENTKENPSEKALMELRLSENPNLGPTISEGAAIMIPNRPGVKLLPGRWKFWIKPNEKEFYPHTVHMRSFIKKIQGRVDPNVYGVVPINLYFSGAANINSSNYTKNAYFRMFYLTLKKYLGLGGLVPKIQVVDDISFPKTVHFNESAKVDRSVIANRLLKASEGINLFFTSLKGPNKELAGISFGSPSPLAKDGYQGGVIVHLPMDSMMAESSPDLLQALFNRAGYVAAHEMGHYLGLLHVCERESRTFEDGLSDTKCEAHSNIMMYGAEEAPFSIQQRMILFRNPLIPLYRNN